MEHSRKRESYLVILKIQGFLKKRGSSIGLVDGMCRDSSPIPPAPGWAPAAAAGTGLA